MSMKRKLIRNLIRREGERLGAKPSKYLRKEFDDYQSKRYGTDVRLVNQAKGTHKRSTWRERVSAVI